MGGASRKLCVHCGQPVIHHNTESRLRIVGGSYAQYGEFPWQVEIQVEENRKWRHQCGGAILGDHTVITAAHCVQQQVNSQLRVLVGKHSLSKQDKHQHIYRVVDVIVHPEFRQEGPHSNDIAILKVEGNNTINGIRCNSHVQSICLPDQNVLMRDMADTCIVTGWGTQIQGSSSISRVLQAATVPLLDLATCRQAQVYGSSNYQILDSMICAGTLEGGVDACGGDSGGPLACKLNGRFVLLGIVSWGEGCAQPNRPGVYTRVSSFIPWIHESLN